MTARTVAGTAWSEILRFEVRYQLRQPLFYLITLFLSVMLFISGTGQAPGGDVGRLHLNAPAIILEQLLKWRYLVLFLMTAFVASAAVRDFDRRTSELFFSKPISRLDYLTARFAGTMVVSAIPYLVSTTVLAASSLMPGLDPARIGPFQLAPYFFGLGVLIMPTLLALGAAFYALASWTRSTLATYVGVVAFFAVSASASLATSRLETRWIGELLDPFGMIALSGALKYWTVAELNSAIPAIGGALLLNRLLWLGLGFSVFALSIIRFDPSRTRQRRSRMQDASKDDTYAAESAFARTRGPRRVFSVAMAVVQFVRQVQREAANVLGGLPFVGMLVLGIVVLVQAANSAGNILGMPVHPRTYLMLESLQGIYSVVLLLVVVLYSGDLIWKERSLELDEIIDSMPVPGRVYLGAKLTALMLVVAVFLFAGVLTLIGFQLTHGYHDLELGLYARGAALAAIYPILMMVLASFCHVAAPNKLAGYGLVILHIIAWDFLEELGFEHHLYRFGSLPPLPYSDFNGYGSFLGTFGWFSLYWGFAAVVVVGLSILFQRSGKDDRWRARLREARARLRGSARAMIAVGTVGFISTGLWIFYSTNIVNAYVPRAAAADSKASYERLYRKYQGIELPRIVAVRAEVDIFPKRRSVDIRGTYRLVNRSTKPLRELHVSIPLRVRVKRLDLPAHDVILEDRVHGYYIFRLRTPLAAEAATELGFNLTVENRGFVNNDAQVAVIENGTYFTKRDFFPVIGYDAQRQLTDPDERRERGMEPVVRLASIDDAAARMNTQRASDADRVDFDATVSTSIDQIAVTSGELQREWVDDGRRYFRYRAESPITHYFAFASAKYEVARADWDGVAIEVYHAPGHDGNLERMMDAARKSLAYCTANFGPYQHRHLRIVEYPRYVRDATSFPGMIAFSESMGFNARLSGGEAIDFPFYVTAHEVAHQWWGQQVVAAKAQGAGMLHETLAQYSSLMVTEREVGRDRLRRVLEYERDWYLRGRSGERGVEPALAFVEQQDYVYYHKGALAMYALRDAAGEASLNAALSRFLSRFARKGPPYSTTADLLSEIRPIVPAESNHLIEDTFERVTMFNNRIDSAMSVEGADGKYLVRIALDASKFRVDGTGGERDVHIDDWIDVAVFGEAAKGGSLLSLERRRITGPPASIEIVVDRQPASVVIDPYCKLIDRTPDDNVGRIGRENDRARQAGGAINP